MSNIDYTLWPNANGNLGEIKVQIPDGVNTTWPEGDALVGNFVYNKGKLVGFVDTKALIANDSKTSTFPYDYVNIQVDKSLESVMTFNQDERTKYFTVTYGESSNSGDTVTFKYKGCKTVDDVKAIDPDYHTNDIVNGVWSERLDDLENGRYMFSYNSYFSEFTSDLSSLVDGYSMFDYCDNLTSFSSDLSSLTNSRYMFAGCTNLTSFTSDLPSLTTGGNMFYNCSKLESFTSDLSSLTNGAWMFYNCSKLESFNCDLPSLTNGDLMFYDCSNLTSFNADLSSLTFCREMFHYCTNLTSFSSDLSSLTYGDEMFSGCKLDTASVQNIADTINTVSSVKLDIGIGNSSPNEQEEAAFNKMVSKGWIVFVNSNYYGGDEGGMYGYAASASLASSAMTLDEIGESEMFSPKPYWAKPINSDEQNARYVDSEGNFYNILGAQFIYGDSLDTYGMFLNEEDAATQMSLTKIEK